MFRRLTKARNWPRANMSQSPLRLTLIGHLDASSGQAVCPTGSWGRLALPCAAFADTPYGAGYTENSLNCGFRRSTFNSTKREEEARFFGPMRSPAWHETSCRPWPCQYRQNRPKTSGSRRSLPAPQATIRPFMQGIRPSPSIQARALTLALLKAVRQAPQLLRSVKQSDRRLRPVAP